MKPVENRSCWTYSFKLTLLNLFFWAYSFELILGNLFLGTYSCNLFFQTYSFKLILLNVFFQTYSFYLIPLNLFFQTHSIKLFLSNLFLWTYSFKLAVPVPKSFWLSSKTFFPPHRVDKSHCISHDPLSIFLFQKIRNFSLNLNQRLKSIDGITVPEAIL